MLEVTDQTDYWLNQFRKADDSHQKRVKQIRRRVLEDESLPDIHRAILGLTCSLETFEKYQGFLAKIGQLAGKPVVMVEGIVPQFRNENERHIKKASAGILTGRHDVRFSRPLGNHGRSTPVFDGATLSLDVNPALTYHYAPSDAPRRDRYDNFYYGEDTSLLQRRTGRYAIDIVRFSQNYGLTDAPVVEMPVGDSLLVDREEIYSSPMFQRGVSKVLQKLEELT